MNGMDLQGINKFCVMKKRDRFPMNNMDLHSIKSNLCVMKKREVFPMNDMDRKIIFFFFVNRKLEFRKWGRGREVGWKGGGKWDWVPPVQPGRVAQSVTCLATDAFLTADPGVRVRSRSGPILSWRLIMK